jgi:predicted nucleotidyltransferase
MTKIIENNIDQLISLCEKYRVSELDVFGSAATGDFDPVRSDIDFLVEFQKSVVRDRFDNFFNLLDELKQLFGRPVDLVEPGGLRNPYFIEMVNQTKRTLYVAP